MMNVAFLWHMHQPHYVDSVAGVSLMPWARMHATKGYLDMIWLVEQYPEFRCTFNLTPVLLEQIEQLARSEVRDLWWEWAATPAEELTPEQKSALLEHYFKANWEHMIKPYPRYWSLLQKRGTQVERRELPEMIGNFDTQEYRDLQVWFHLTWFGYAAARLYPEIAELKRKGRDFTEQEKQIVFARQQDVLRTLTGRYKAAADRGQVELCTSPFYHPILPLVYNNEFARRCMPGCRLPPTFSRPEDVRAQLELAKEQHARLFGQAPHGLWPSEGAVCPELIPPLQELGFEWFATDEEILWRSLPNGHNPDRSFLYQPFKVEHGSAHALAVFRDRSLSDFIGFVAARQPPREAADRLVRQIEGIRSQKLLQGDSGLCSIILDGENAWEHFADGGETFLRALYERLLSHPHLRPTTIHEHLQQASAFPTLQRLHSGSWINADFHIWIGDLEDNQAWQLLKETRDFVETQTVEPKLRERLLREIYAAEGSDWFWWYGEQFGSDNDWLFDEVFRIHLQNVYRLLGVPVPPQLGTRIRRSKLQPPITLPAGPITPVIDGKLTYPDEWSRAGRYEAERPMTAMYRGAPLLKALLFGNDSEHLYLRFDFASALDGLKQTALRLCFQNPLPLTLEIALASNDPDISVLEGEKPPSFEEAECKPGDVPSGSVLEVKLPLPLLDARPKEEISFFAELVSSFGIVERHPESEPIRMRLGD